MQRLKNSISELDQLKELLLVDELAQLKELASKLESLDFEAQDEETILARVTPLFDRILLERLQNKDAQTQNILSQYLAHIITQTSMHDASGLSRSLQSVISPIISKEIADNKDTMIDALYPIMGGMISKYVTQAIKEMMETINKKIENGLSTERLKRKLKSKFTGVSETELLIEESADAKIFSLFVIHKETSLLIAEAYLDNQQVDDAHMVASMASAIKDFINDWIENNDTMNEVQLLSYGNATLYIESAGSVYVIAFLDSEPDHGLRQGINTFFASLLKKYATFFQNYDGDDSTEEVKALSDRMSNYLHGQNMMNKKEKKNPLKYLFYVLAVVFVGYGIYFFNVWYMQHSLEDEVYAQTGKHISIHKIDDTLLLKGQVDSTDSISEIVKLIKRRSDLSIDNHLLVPMMYLDKRIKSESNNDNNITYKIDAKLESLEHHIENSLKDLRQENIRLEKQLEGIVKSKTAELLKLQNEKKSLQKILEIQKVIAERLDVTFKDSRFYVAEENALNFQSLKLFEAGTSVYKKEAITLFAKTFERYLSVLTDYKEYINVIIIEGHSDSSGLEEENIALSKKRALSIKDFLEQLKMLKQYHMTSLIDTKGLGSSQAIVSVDGIEDKEKSRRIKIKFELSDEKVVNRLRGLLID